MVRLRYKGQRKLMGRHGWIKDQDYIEVTQAEFNSIKKSGDWQKHWIYAKKHEQEVRYTADELDDLDREVLMEIIRKLQAEGRPIKYYTRWGRRDMAKAIKSVIGATKNPIYTPENPDEVGVVIMAKKAPGKNIASDKIDDVRNKVLPDTTGEFE